MPGPLKNARQEAFCLLIIGPVAKGEMSQAEAYGKAGYKPKNMEVAAVGATKLVRQGHIEARVVEMQAAQRAVVAKVMDRYELTTDKIVRQLAYTAFADIGDLMKVVKREVGGVEVEVEVMKDIREMTPEQRSCIKLVALPDGTLRKELRDPAASLRLLGLHRGMFAGEDGGFGGLPPGEVHIHNDNRTQVYVDHAPRETREQWESRIRARIARSDEPVRQRPVDAAAGPAKRRD